MHFLLLPLLACAPPDAVPSAVALSQRIPLGGRAPTPPEMPAILADTHLMEPDALGVQQFTRPMYPALRTTADGRLGVNVRTRNEIYELVLLGPEGLTEPLGRSDPGVQGVLDQTEILPGDLFDAVSTETANHAIICDPTSEFPAPGERTNPYPCAGDPAQDCYDLTIIIDVQAACNDSGCEGVDEAFDTKLWGTEVTVAVDQPKTTAATIASVTLGQPVASGVFDIRGFYEPSITGDGHLLIARLDWTRVPVPDELDPAQTELRAMNMAYVLPDDPDAWAPCDVAQWDHVEPIAHLPYDPAAARYPLAAAPFRDGEGHVVGDYDTVGLSYPWVDRGGTNVFFTSARSTLFYDADLDPAVDDVRARYPWKCLPGVACAAPVTDEEIQSFEDPFITRGIGVMGLWTRGKMVVLDSPLNHTDFGIGRDQDDHRLIGLYQPGTGADPLSTGWIHVGTGRDNAGVAPLGTTQNTAFMDSFENRYFWQPAMLPTSVGEIVWTVNTGHGSAEVVFDDFLDAGAFLVADMGAAATQTALPGRDSLVYRDGFVRTPAVGKPGFREAVHFQNASTVLAEEWAVPAAGYGFGGVRLEPVALGGVHAKGAWLAGKKDGIVFPVLAQPKYDVAATEWYTGIFLDPRFEDDGVLRSILSWPDGSVLGVRGLGTLVVLDAAGAEAASIALPDGGLWPVAWRHLGFNLTNGGTTLDVLVDGFPWATATLPSPLLLPTEGELVLGDRPGDAIPGWRGWADERKIFSYAASPEIACNRARGTLVELGPTADEAWQLIADARPTAAHDAISAALGAPAGPRYVCFHDYTAEIAVGDNVAPPPADTTSVRHALLRPNATFVAGLPRPDESDAPFCASCHVAGQHPALGPEALVFDRTLPLEDDPRRQPMQPPRLVFGNVPADLVGPGLPATDLVAPPEGLLLDLLIY